LPEQRLSTVALPLAVRRKVEEHSNLTAVKLFSSAQRVGGLLLEGKRLASPAFSLPQKVEIPQSLGHLIDSASVKDV